MYALATKDIPELAIPVAHLSKGNSSRDDMVIASPCFDIFW